MVRSLLNSSLLQRSEGLRFVFLVLGMCILLASVVMWVGLADFDYHFSYGHELDSPSFVQKTHATPYEQLDGTKKHIVDAAFDGRSFTFEDDTKDLPEIVNKNGVYYKFASNRAIDWTNPNTFGPTVFGFVGLWLVLEAIQHERKSLGPRGI
ncbi:MAG TPA: hypothetical protein VFJ06_10880 [Halococcus sp.]|nr:hypothetical protein [Halococcus sp.]